MTGLNPHPRKADCQTHDHGTHQHDSHDRARDHTGSAAADPCCAAAPLTVGAPRVAVLAAGQARTAIRITQMDCPTEETLIRNVLGTMQGVHDMEFNLMQRVLTVVHRPEAIDNILQAVRGLGFKPEITPSGSAPQALAEPAKPSWPLALAGVAAIGAEAANWTGAPQWLAAAMALAAIAACGIGTYRKGWTALRHGNLNINALMSIAVTGALLLRQWPEAAMVMVLFTLAESIEERSLDRARNAIKGLLQLAPSKATVLQADGSWRPVIATTVALDEQVRIMPGERIGLDGIVTSGGSSVNQAPITGESLPVDKAIGDTVFAGTVNTSGSFEYRVTAAAGNTMLARIIHAVEQAQGSKAPTQRFVDRFARVYTPLVFAGALLVAIVPPLLTGANWGDWVYKALVLLVIACPCALVISTPVTVVSGLATAARQRDPDQGRRLPGAGAQTGLAGARQDRHVDPWQSGSDRVRGAQLLGQRSEWRTDTPPGRQPGWSLRPSGIAGDRPCGRCRGPSAIRRGRVRSTAGPWRARRDPGRHYSLGNQRLIQDMGLGSTELESRMLVLERQGKTVVLLADREQVLGLFAVADTVKASSAEAIAQLHALGIRTMMLTGDNPHTAQAIAAEVGIDEVRGNQLPEDKLRAVDELTAKGVVGMVGDGINDAPALARADIGFAMGAAGTDAAIETADVALMDDDLRKIPTFVRLSRATASAGAEHRAGAGHQGGVPGPHAGRSGHDVDGGIRRRGRQLLVVGNGLRRCASNAAI